ncbi:MAG: outer membrane lipoprotein-sorting protein [Campylobacterales bacterium]|nr:outer membrane lipoprotein-sorting protein [Campylobacterales bacterium]
MRFLAVFLLLASVVFSSEVDEIVKKLDENMRGKDISLTLRMKIVSMGHEREMRIESYSKGSDKSFTKILYPPKSRGITFLSLDGQMWQYVPKIERIIKIPPSMMLQNWMGSDITNDDMVKQSSIIDDYDATLLKKEGDIATIEFVPKPYAPVVWGKIISQIDLKTYTSTKDTFYDENGGEVRFFIYKDVKKCGEYFIPTYWRVSSVDKVQNYTEIFLEDIKYDSDISDAYFTKSALKRFSK